MHNNVERMYTMVGAANRVGAGFHPLHTEERVRCVVGGIILTRR